jgi:hypothetical protein
MALAAHTLSMLGSQLGLELEVYTMGPTARLIGQSMGFIPALTTAGGRETRKAALCLVDRIVDPVTPALHADLLVQRMLAALPPMELQSLGGHGDGARAATAAAPSGRMNRFAAAERLVGMPCVLDSRSPAPWGSRGASTANDSGAGAAGAGGVAAATEATEATAVAAAAEATLATAVAAAAAAAAAATAAVAAAGGGGSAGGSGAAVAPCDAPPAPVPGEALLHGGLLLHPGDVQSLKRWEFLVTRRGRDAALFLRKWLREAVRKVRGRAVAVGCEGFPRGVLVVVVVCVCGGGGVDGAGL